MFKRIFILSILSLCMFMACRSMKATVKENHTPYVILKLDDLWYKDNKIHDGWQFVISFLNQNNIVSSIGIVGESLVDNNPVYFDWILKRHAEGHEIWNHGFCHCRDKEKGVSEFRGNPEKEQLVTLRKTQALAKEKLNITLTTFGAPYNWTDESTARSIDKISDLKTWMYKETPTHTDKLVLKRIKEVNIEYPVHVPDYNEFVAGYNKNKEQEVLVIQGHPRSWSEDKTRMEAFKKIIFFLKNEKVRFVTPHEYYLLKKNKS